MDRESRRRIQYETLRYIEENPEINETTMANMHSIVPHRIAPVGPPRVKIFISEADSLDATLYGQMTYGARFCCLIMGNAYRKGGGYLNGAGAQEESICRRTNLPYCFQKLSYPIPELGCVYIKDLRVLRGAESIGYEFHEVAPYCDAIISCAHQNPRLTAFGKFHPEQYRSTRNKIQSILDTCLEYDRRYLVLGAYGCGAFNNPPEQVARIFLELLSLPKYQGEFRVIIFAILDNERSHNYDIFREVLEPILTSV